MSHRKRREAGDISITPRRGDTPSFLETDPLPLLAVPVPPEVKAAMINAANDYLRAYMLGACSVLVTREYGEWHLSIDGKGRYPTWLEISEAWYRCVPGAEHLTGALILPPLREYINRNEFCMQVRQIEEST